MQEMVGEFDPAALSYHWQHRDPRVDRLRWDVQEAVKAGEAQGQSRAEIFGRIWALAHEAAGEHAEEIPGGKGALPRAAVPYLNEPWYC